MERKKRRRKKAESIRNTSPIRGRSLNPSKPDPLIVRLMSGKWKNLIIPKHKEPQQERKPNTRQREI
jgi:hypothetical protein